MAAMEELARRRGCVAWSLRCSLKIADLENQSSCVKLECGSSFGAEIGTGPRKCGKLDVPLEPIESGCHRFCEPSLITANSFLKLKTLWWYIYYIMCHIIFFSVMFSGITYIYLTYVLNSSFCKTEAGYLFNSSSWSPCSQLPIFCLYKLVLGSSSNWDLGVLKVTFCDKHHALQEHSYCVKHVAFAYLFIG